MIETVLEQIINELSTNPKYLHFAEGRSASDTGLHHLKAKGDFSNHPDLEQKDILVRKGFDTEHFNLRKKYATQSDFDELAEAEKELEKDWKAQYAYWKIENKIPIEEYVKFGEEYFPRWFPEVVSRNTMLHKDGEEHCLLDRVENLNTPFLATVRGNLMGNSYVFRVYWEDYTHDPRGGTVKYALAIPKEKINEIVPLLAEHPDAILKIAGKAFPEMDNSKGQLKVVDNLTKIRDAPYPIEK